MREKFETETLQSANSTFGAYVMKAAGSNLLIGLSNDPGNYDGALITKSADGSTFTTEFTPEEQGIHELDVESNGVVYVPGTDPFLGWDLGILYTRLTDGTWITQRTLPLTIHSLGFWKSADGTLYVCGGMHTGDSQTWKGRSLKSTDDGSTWAAVDINDYRVMDVIGHAGKLYAVGYDWTGSAYTQDLHVSSDAGATWSKIAGVTPSIKSRMIAFGTALIVAGASGLYQIDSSHVVTAHSTPFAPSLLWNTLASDGSNLYVLDASGYVWRSSDLTNWTRYTFVSNAIALTWWPGVGLMIADSGVSAQIWIA